MNNRAVVIEENLFPYIKDVLATLLKLWLAEEANEVFVFRHPKGAGNSPAKLRRILTELHGLRGLDGVFLIGDLPVAFFNQSYASVNMTYTSDYYFMELAGRDWTVGEANLVATPINRPPGICAGRLLIGEATNTGPSGTGIAAKYRRYLQKCIEYRTRGESYRQGRKAVMVSNLGGVAAYATHLRNLYAAVAPVDSATKDQYTTILKTDYDWILYYGHSDAGGHAFPAGQYWSQSDYGQSDIHINIFQFEACGVGAIAWQPPKDPYDPNGPKVAAAMSDSVSANILGHPDRGVLVLAPSIPGFFDQMDRFYEHLRTGHTYGGAFALWMTEQLAGGKPHYMNLYGDPFLRFDSPYLRPGSSWIAPSNWRNRIHYL